MLKKYLIVFLVSMVPLIELRGAIPISQGMGLPIWTSYVVSIIGNMVPVPFIYLFARKILEWGADKPVIGKFFTFCLEKGHKGAGEGRTRTLCGIDAFRRDSVTGNRCMDRNTGSQPSGYEV